MEDTPKSRTGAEKMSANMSMVVARMQKMKSANLTGSQMHNQREFENHSNKNIDTEKEHLNYDLIHDEKINYQDTVKEIVDSQRESTRAVRKDAVLVNEWLITSNQDFFKGFDEEKTKEFFEKSLEYFSDKFGNQNMAYAQVHLDETTPHMHLGIVPMSDDGRLSGKTVFNRQALKEIQEDFPKYLQEKGFDIERGIEGSERKNLSIETYKKVVEQATKEAEVEIKKETQLLKKNEIGLRENINKNIQKLNTVSGALSNAYDAQLKLDEFENKLERSIFGSKRMINKEELKELKLYVTGFQKQAVKNITQSIKVDQKNEKLTEQLLELSTRLEVVEKQNQRLHNENSELNLTLEKETNRRIVYSDMLSNDYGVKSINKEEINARIVLNKLEQGEKPKDKNQGEVWQNHLEQAKGKTKIKESRLEEGIEQIKEMIRKIIERAKELTMNLIR